MDDTRLNPPDVDVDELGRELTGDQPEGDQVAYRREGEVENLEFLAEQELRAGETDDPDIAAEEGLTWVPPVDPPVVPDPDDPQGIQVAAGFATTAEDEPFDADHHDSAMSAEDEFADRVREALRADAATSRYADAVAIGTRAGTVAVRGVVDDMDDTDNIVAVINRVTGVDQVVDELEVRGVTD